MQKFAIVHKAAAALVVLCFTLCSAAAQYECSIKNFNTNNGLPQNEITAMAMDYDGYLWLGTRSGLVRYDGSGFKTFLFKRKNREWGDMVLHLMNIPEERKVIMIARDGASYSLEKGRPVLLYDTSGANIGANILGSFPSVSFFKKYQFAISSLLAGLNCVFPKPQILPVNQTDFIVFCEQSDCLIFYKNGVRQRVIKAGHQPVFFGMSKNHLFSVDKDKQMYLYDIAGEKFNKINVDWSAFGSHDISLSDIHLFNGAYSNELLCYYKSSVFVMQFDSSKNQVKFLPQFVMTGPTKIVIGMVYDSTNSTFFLRTENDGIFQVKLKKIKTLNTTEILEKNGILKGVINYAVLRTSDSTVVIPAGLQFTFGSSAPKIKKLGNVVGERETIGLLADRSILVDQKSGLYYYSPVDEFKNRHIYNEAFNQKNSGSPIVMVYPEGDSVWVGSYDGFYCITRNKIDSIFNKNNIADSNYNNFRMFLRINKEEAFVVNETGLYKLKTSSPFLIKALPEMHDMQVRNIVGYKDMFILSVYRQGLYVLKDGKFYKVPLNADYPALMSCHSTHIDKDGFIWIPTDRGLYKSTAASVVESALNPAGGAPFFFYYGNDDGIDNTEFNGSGMPAYAVLGDGRVFYPSMLGIVTFKPADVPNEITGSAIIIEKILVDNDVAGDIKDSIQLKGAFKYLAIDLVVPNFGDAKNLSIEYRLDSKGWKKLMIADNNRITLVDISAGDHNLTIRRRTGFSNSDYAYRKFFIHREKYIYQQFWFFLLMVGLLALIVKILLHLQTRNLERKKILLQQKVNEQTAELMKGGEVKDLLINIILHDMATPLKHISLVANILIRGLEKEPEKVNEALNVIKSTAEKILSGSLSIINWIKLNNENVAIEKTSIHLYSLANEILEIFAPLAKSKNIVLINEIPPSKFVEADHNILSTILNNLISNAVKFTVTGEVRLFLQQADASIKAVLTVSDTGPGMKKEALNVVREVLKGNLQVIKSTNKINTGLGYVMIAELLKIHNLYVYIDSEAGKGTAVSLFIS